MERNKITEGSIFKGLMAFFFPIWMGTFFQQMYNTVDAVVVGNFVGKEALGAVGGATGTIINLLVGFFVGLSSGASVIIAQYFGARNSEMGSRGVHTAIALALSGGAVMTVVGIVFSPAILRAMDTPPDVMDFAVTYLRIYFGGIIFGFIYNIGSGILRAVGDSKRPLYFLIVCCFCNVVLDILFVAVLHMGVAGAALATIISQAVSAVLIWLCLMRGPEIYRLHPKQIRLDMHLLGQIVRIGLPAGLQSMMYSFSNIVIQSSMNSFGTNVVAAWAAYGKIDGLFWMTLQSFGIAITTYAGQNFGARRYDRMRKSVKVCAATATGFTMALSVLLLVMGPILYRLFTKDDTVLNLGIEILWNLVPYYFTYIAIEVLSGALRGTGDAVVPMILTCLGVCVLRVAWIWFVVPQSHTLATVCFSYPLTWAITSVLFLIYYIQGGWLRRSKQRAGHLETEAAGQKA